MLFSLVSNMGYCNQKGTHSESDAFLIYFSALVIHVVAVVIAQSLKPMASFPAAQESLEHSLARNRRGGFLSSHHIPYNA